MSNEEQKKAKVDYTKMEADWRAGLLSPRQIAAKYTDATGVKVSHAAVIKHFNKAAIERDLAAQIREKAKAKVTEAAVTGKVTPERTVTDSQIVEANATLQANALLDHRKDIKRHRMLALKLLEEIESETGDTELFERLGEIMRSEDDKGQDKRNDLYMKVISTPSRIDSMKKLSETLKNLISLERQALGLDDADPDGGDAGKLTDDQVSARINSLLNKARSAA